MLRIRTLGRCSEYIRCSATFSPQSMLLQQSKNVQCDTVTCERRLKSLKRPTPHTISSLLLVGSMWGGKSSQRNHKPLCCRIVPTIFITSKSFPWKSRKPRRFFLIFVQVHSAGTKKHDKHTLGETNSLSSHLKIGRKLPQKGNDGIFQSSIFAGAFPVSVRVKTRQPGSVAVADSNCFLHNE